MTRYAEQILAAVNSSTEHLTAAGIYMKMKKENSKVSLATVYNNLNRLYAMGLVRKVTGERGPDRYDKTRRHDHLICKRCGRITDVELTDLTRRIAQEIGENPLYYDLRISYICPVCKETE